MQFPDTDCGMAVLGFYKFDDAALQLDNESLGLNDEDDSLEDGNSSHNVAYERRKWVVFNNVLNGLSWVLSPIIGVIRLIAACIVNDNCSEEYFTGQIVRGVTEIFGAGLILLITDIVITIMRYGCGAS